MWKVEIVGGDILKVEIDGGEKGGDGRWRISRMMESGTHGGGYGNNRNDG